MILVFGEIANPTIALLMARLLELDCDVRLIDARRFPGDFSAQWRGFGSNLDGWVSWDGGRVTFAQLKAIYVGHIAAPPWSPFLPERNEGERIAHSGRAEGYRLLGALTEVAPCPVFNRPRDYRFNCVKASQREKIEQRGFRYPRTLLTTSSEAALRFHSQCRDGAIYKSAGQRRSFARRLGEPEVLRLERCPRCVLMLQEYVPGIEIRVHIVGDEAFGTRIESDAVDYRYAMESGERCDFSTVVLSNELVERCVNLTRDVGLQVSGLDLRIDPDGREYCLEVNPCPAFGYYEARTGQPIGRAVALLLRSAVGPTSSKSRSGSDERPFFDVHDDDFRPSGKRSSRSPAMDRNDLVAPLIAEVQPIHSGDIENPPSTLSRFALRRLSESVWAVRKPRQIRRPRFRWEGGADERLRRADSVAWTEDRGEATLLRMMTGTWFSLNESATHVWRTLAEEPSVREICERFAAHYGLSEDLGQRDVTAILRGLQAEELIEHAEGVE